MIKYNFVILISIFIFSCKKNENIKTVYNREEYMNLWVKDKNIDSKIKTIDTFCINQTKRAKEDIKNGKLTFFISRFECEFNGMRKLLGKYNIEVKHQKHFDVIIGGFRDDCYEIVMFDEIFKRFSEKHIDSLMQITEKDFVLNNPDSLYIKDGKDVRLKYKSEIEKLRKEKSVIKNE